MSDQNKTLMDRMREVAPSLNSTAEYARGLEDPNTFQVGPDGRVIPKAIDTSRNEKPIADLGGAEPWLQEILDAGEGHSAEASEEAPVEVEVALSSEGAGDVGDLSKHPANKAEQDARSQAAGAMAIPMSGINPKDREVLEVFESSQPEAGVGSEYIPAEPIAADQGQAALPWEGKIACESCAFCWMTGVFQDVGGNRPDGSPYLDTNMRCFAVDGFLTDVTDHLIYKCSMYEKERKKPFSRGWFADRAAQLFEFLLSKLLKGKK